MLGKLLTKSNRKNQLLLDMRKLYSHNNFFTKEYDSATDDINLLEN